MKSATTILATCLLALPALVGAQTTVPPADLQNPSLSPTPNSRAATRANNQALTRYQTRQEIQVKPLSRIGVSAGVGTMGINMQVATNLTKHFNVRGVGNYFDYTMTNETIDSYTVNGKVNFATGGVSLDYFPWAFHGLRLSPGVQFYNDNSAYSTVRVAGGTKLSLNNIDYYSSSADPITGTGGVQFNMRKPTPTMTIGWGNLINRRGGHWSFPVELGAAMMDAPGVNVALTGGQACNAAGTNCVNVANDATVQANLTAQVNKYRHNLDPYKFYPILSFGVGYNFRIR